MSRSLPERTQGSRVDRDKPRQKQIALKSLAFLQTREGSNEGSHPEVQGSELRTGERRRGGKLGAEGKGSSIPRQGT